MTGEQLSTLVNIGSAGAVMESWLVTLLKEGGTVAIAAVALWMLNRVWDDRLTESQRHNAALQQLIVQLQKTIEENTRVIAVFLERTRPVKYPETSNGSHEKVME